VNDKLGRLKKYLSRFKTAIIAYSGGVDSTFLLKVSADVLGKNNVVAVTAVSETYLKSDLEFSKKIISKLGVIHIIIHTGEYSNPDFIRNDKLRCYYCKSELFKKIRRIAGRYHNAVIFDGSNYSDMDDIRPGRKACLESGVISPLQELKFTKPEIRRLSRKLKLPSWNKPQMACLSSRIPFGTAINKKILKDIEVMENYLYGMGLSFVRVRYTEISSQPQKKKILLARIETTPENYKNIISGNRKKIVDYIKKLGYNYITLDLEGYRPAGTQV